MTHLVAGLPTVGIGAGLMLGLPWATLVEAVLLLTRRAHRAGVGVGWS